MTQFDLLNIGLGKKINKINNTRKKSSGNQMHMIDPLIQFYEGYDLIRPFKYWVGFDQIS